MLLNGNTSASTHLLHQHRILVFFLFKSGNKGLNLASRGDYVLLELVLLTKQSLVLLSQGLNMPQEALIVSLSLLSKFARLPGVLF